MILKYTQKPSGEAVILTRHTFHRLKCWDKRTNNSYKNRC